MTAVRPYCINMGLYIITTPQYDYLGTCQGCQANALTTVHENGSGQCSDSARGLSSKDFRLAFMEKWFEIEQNGLHHRFSHAILDRDIMPDIRFWLFCCSIRLFSLTHSCCRCPGLLRGFRFLCLFFAFHGTITVLVVISERVATQIAYMLHPQTICYRLSTIGAKKTVPVILGQRLKNFGNPGQRQQEWKNGGEVHFPIKAKRKSLLDNLILRMAS
eukprot:sb/3469949/